MVLNRENFKIIVSPSYDWDKEMMEILTDGNAIEKANTVNLMTVQDDQIERGRIIFEIVQMGNLQFAIINHWTKDMVLKGYNTMYEMSKKGRTLCAIDTLNRELIVRKTLVLKNGIVEL